MPLIAMPIKRGLCRTTIHKTHENFASRLIPHPKRIGRLVELLSIVHAADGRLTKVALADIVAK